MNKPPGKFKGPPERSQAKALMENIRQLLYLLAFTTGFDFPIMEREFITIDKRFRRFKQQQKEREMAAVEWAKMEELLNRVEKQMENLSMAVYRTDQNYEP